MIYGDLWNAMTSSEVVSFIDKYEYSSSLYHKLFIIHALINTVGEI